MAFPYAVVSKKARFLNHYCVAPFIDPEMKRQALDLLYHAMLYSYHPVAVNVFALAMWRHSLLVQPGTVDE